MVGQLDLDFWSSTNERHLDFKHKNTWEALWVEDGRNPPRVAAEIAAKAPGIVQFNISACDPKLTKYVKDGQLEKHVLAWLQLKRVGVFIRTSFKAVWNLMSLWGVA
ncbi:unnamed protein product [Sphagnum compactum]